MANWLRLPSGRLVNLDLIVDIDHDVAGAHPWATATLPAAAAAGSEYDSPIKPATIGYGGADARALIRHFCDREVVRDAPLATTKLAPPAEQFGEFFAAHPDMFAQRAAPASPPTPPRTCHACLKPGPRLYGLDLPDGTTVGICPDCEGERLAEIARERRESGDDTPF